MLRPTVPAFGFLPSSATASSRFCRLFLISVLFRRRIPSRSTGCTSHGAGARHRHLRVAEVGIPEKLEWSCAVRFIENSVRSPAAQSSVHASSSRKQTRTWSVNLQGESSVGNHAGRIRRDRSHRNARLDRLPSSSSPRRRTALRPSELCSRVRLLRDGEGSLAGIGVRGGRALPCACDGGDDDAGRSRERRERSLFGRDGDTGSTQGRWNGCSEGRRCGGRDERWRESQSEIRRGSIGRWGQVRRGRRLW